MNVQTEWVLSLADARAASIERCGGKAAGLAATLRAGLPVPPGFCVVAEAYARWFETCRDGHVLMDKIEAIAADDVAALSAAGAALRAALGETPVPAEVAEAVRAAARALGDAPVAVRSSATLEDLPDASFAGQQETYLNVRGEAEVVARVRDCWVSLFTDRAIVYRRRLGLSSRSARLAAVVQRMVEAEVAGIMFTADPVSGDREVCTIDAGFGLGEALVSGRVTADLYRARKRDGQLLAVTVGEKALAAVYAAGGGVELKDVPADRRAARALDDATVAALVGFGRTLERLRGGPQDVEWALAGGQLFVLQSRPITSLYPLPDGVEPGGPLRLYISFGHLQVNTAAMPPMALSVFQRLFPFRRDAGGRSRAMLRAGHRLFVDATPLLHRLPLRKVVPAVLQVVDSQLAARVRAVMSRPEFPASRPADAASFVAAARFVGPPLLRGIGNIVRAPEGVRARFESNLAALVGEAERAVGGAGTVGARLTVIGHVLVDIFPAILRGQAMTTLIPGVVAWRMLDGWARRRGLGDAAGDLLRGLSGNATTDMDLELGDLADLLHARPQLAQAFLAAEPRAAIEALRGQPGGEVVLAAWDRFIGRYGVRCPGEIDITRPRWRDDPSSVIQGLRSALTADRAGAHREQHAAATAAGEAAGAALIEAAGGGLLGGLRRRIVAGLVRRVRVLVALREHPKLAMMRIFAVLHDAIRGAGEWAVARGLLAAVDDVWLLEFEELVQAVAAAERGDTTPWTRLRAAVSGRREAFRRAQSLAPPRLMTNSGEVPTAASAALEPGTMRGIGASAGIVEGVARVIRDPARESLQAGQILVAPFTDPAWTPLFLHAAGLVMEVGGMMTHGSVVAREYGIPAVVGVDGALATIRDGQRLRVDGDRGLVIVLAEPEAA